MKKFFIALQTETDKVLLPPLVTLIFEYTSPPHCYFVQINGSRVCDTRNPHELDYFCNSFNTSMIFGNVFEMEEDNIDLSGWCVHPIEVADLASSSRSRKIAPLRQLHKQTQCLCESPALEYALLWLQMERGFL